QQAADLQLQDAIHSARVLRAPLEPTDEQLWAGLDEEYRWVTAPVSRERLVQLNQHAVDFFTSHYPGTWAERTLRDRLGSDLRDDPRFSPGYAPGGFTALATDLRNLGASDEELL